jgi:hypothetical protein
MGKINERVDVMAWVAVAFLCLFIVIPVVSVVWAINFLRVPTHFPGCEVGQVTEVHFDEEGAPTRYFTVVVGGEEYRSEVTLIDSPTRFRPGYYQVDMSNEGLGLLRVITGRNQDGTPVLVTGIIIGEKDVGFWKRVWNLL